ncbi:MAG: hypothetical protein GY847_12540 [Proteobacteria bacterium]|nr:hypothetical protein [Pseudomonadota bacterium]
MGLAVSNNLILGSRFWLGHENRMTDDDNFPAFFLGIFPYLEYIFPNKVVRPSLLAVIGYQGARGETQDRKFKEWSISPGGGVGIHFFIFPVLSIDTEFLFYYRAGWGEFTEDNDYMEYDSSYDDKYSFHRFSFDLNIGLSAWI